MFTGIGNSHLYTALRLEASFAVPGLDEAKTVTGTGFFVKNKSNRLCLITNRHVLELGYDRGDRKYSDARLKALVVNTFLPPTSSRHDLPTQLHRAHVRLGERPIKFPNTYAEDVACIVDPRFDSPLPGQVLIEYFFAHDVLADDEWLATKLSACDFVAFPGFPAWYDKLGKRPILRTGTIASDPRADYSDTPTHRGRRIAFEAFSTDGSSGSPIIALSTGFRVDGLTSTGYREGKVVGINAGHLLGPHGSHSGVSYFIKSSAILDLIDDDA